MNITKKRRPSRKKHKMRRTRSITHNKRTKTHTRNVKTITTKYKHLQHNKKHYKMKYGGMVSSNPILQKIISIGFEMETANMTPVTVLRTAKTIEGDKVVFIDSDTNKIFVPTLSEEVNIGIDYTVDGELEKAGIDPNSIVATIDSKIDTPIHTLDNSTLDNSLLANLEKRIVDDKELGLLAFLRDNNIEPTYGKTTYDEYRLYFHTEYVFTFYPTHNQNVIMQYFQFVVQYLMNAIVEGNHIESQEHDIKIKEYFNQMATYLIPMRYADDFTPSTIKWVPQLTINIKLVDMIDVISYLSEGTPYKEAVDYCIQYANIFDDVATDSSGNELTNHINASLKATLFMILYLVKCLGGNYNKHDDIAMSYMHIFEKGAYKDFVVFLFRTPVSSIIYALQSKYGGKFMDCLQLLKIKLSKKMDIYKQMRNAKLQQRKTRSRSQDANENIDQDYYYAYKAYYLFIGFFTHFIFVGQKGSIVSVSDRLNTSIYYNVLRAQDMDKYNEARKPGPEYYEKYEPAEQLLLYFSKLFSQTNAINGILGTSTYYPFDVHNESLLIEYRSFSQNLIMESGTVDTSVQKTLLEWNDIIHTIQTREQSPTPAPHEPAVEPPLKKPNITRNP